MTASSSTDDKLAFLNMRTPFILPKVFCVCLRNRKGKNAKEKGLSRIDKELEIDKFLQNQIKMKIAIQSLFSKVERFLIRNNKRFVIETDLSDGESSSELIVKEPMLENVSEHQDQRFSLLLE